MKGLLTYIPGSSLLHRLDPRTKLFVSLLLCVGVFASSSIVYLLVILALDLLLGRLGGVFHQTFGLLRKLLRVMLFIFVLQLLFIQRGETVVPLVFGLRITDVGVRTALSVVLRLIGATLPLCILLMVTKLDDLANSLVVRYHIPYKYAFALTTAIRFVPEFSKEMQEVIEAQTTRGVELDTKNIFRKIALVIPLCVPLLISSVRKIDGTAMAAELRGFNRRSWKNMSSAFRFRLPDAIALLLAAGVAVIGILL